MMSRWMLALALMASAFAISAEQLPDKVILFKNISIFDGKNEQLIKGTDVLVVGNKIHEIAKDIPIGGSYQVEVTSGGGSKVKAVSGFAPSVYASLLGRMQRMAEGRSAKVVDTTGI